MYSSLFPLRLVLFAELLMIKVCVDDGCNCLGQKLTRKNKHIERDYIILKPCLWFLHFVLLLNIEISILSVIHYLNKYLFTSTRTKAIIQLLNTED